MYYTRPPKKFLKINNLEIKEGIYRAVNELSSCLRCSVVEKASIIGANLVNFVCEYCRKDEQEWDYAKREDGISYTIKAMINEMPENEMRNDLKQRTHNGY